MTKLTGDDRKLGPVTYGKTSGWRALSLVWSSGDDERPGNVLTGYACGWAAQVSLPKILAPWAVRHVAKSWSEETIARLGRDWYDEFFPREYGFMLCDGHLHLRLGAQTQDSTTTQDWSCFLPWTQWRHVRLSFYDDHGASFWTSRDGNAASDFDAQYAAKQACPKRRFALIDFDGQRIEATTMIEEREWRLGTKWCRWLSLFSRPKIRRSLDIEFSAEVGPEKGSWKGGTLGHGIEMLPGELHEAAFRRYCQQEHRGKHAAFRISFAGVVA